MHGQTLQIVSDPPFRRNPLLTASRHSLDLRRFSCCFYVFRFADNNKCQLLRIEQPRRQFRNSLSRHSVDIARSFVDIVDPEIVILNETSIRAIAFVELKRSGKEPVRYDCARSNSSGVTRPSCIRDHSDFTKFSDSATRSFLVPALPAINADSRIGCRYVPTE